MGESGETAPAGRRGWAVPLLATFVAIVWLLPPVRALVDPPPQRFFAGAFAYQDDVFQYLSFAEQASRGAWVFVNKFDTRFDEPFFVNAGWWLVGLVGRLVGSLPLGLHLVSAAASVALVFGVARLLGLGRAPVLPGLLLVLLAGRLDGPLSWLGVATGVPYLLLPTDHLAAHVSHSLLSLALLVWAILFHVEWTNGIRRSWPFLVLVTVLGLVRPFDFAIAVAVAMIVGIADVRRGGWGALRPHLQLVWLTPVAFYLSLALWLHPSFALWSGSQNVVARPGLIVLVGALGVPLILAVTGVWRTRCQAPSPATVPVVAWGVACLVAFVLAPSIGVQAVTSLGLAVLLLAGMTLPARVLWSATLLLLLPSIGLFAEQWRPPPEWFPPRDYETAARFLAMTCEPRDVVYGPSDPSLVVAALSPCRVAFGHRVLTPEIERRARESVAFYDARTSAVWRRRYLRELGATFVLLPPRGERYVGAAPGDEFRPMMRLATFEVWSVGVRAP